MFETAIPSPVAELGAAGTLRAIEWSEIVARFGAMRDLRALFARPAVAGGGFVPQVATGIAGPSVGERNINLAALATGKWTTPTTAAAARASGHGDRDN
jgi:hypothetical protein